jgi:hypothetical protein
MQRYEVSHTSQEGIKQNIVENNARRTNLGLVGSRGQQLGGRAAAAGYASQDSQPG